jgi:hypothetical protein
MLTSSFIPILVFSRTAFSSACFAAKTPPTCERRARTTRRRWRSLSRRRSGNGRALSSRNDQRGDGGDCLFVTISATLDYTTDRQQDEGNRNTARKKGGKRRRLYCLPRRFWSDSSDISCSSIASACPTYGWGRDFSSASV